MMVILHLIIRKFTREIIIKHSEIVMQKKGKLGIHFYTNNNNLMKNQPVKKKGGNQMKLSSKRIGMIYIE